ncbi:hypothetical protein EHQ76_09615 [Leptospira barantonii]|uniref:Uncharacterized protein n=1 Tax=Leptospira barantonii TaxID=2023184 RepID=A0A5F2BD34_9LEPT|nr:hypothetical protein [Leptospira barantonii]TGM03461.1 hypothetical protein EHQ76_09615 [Leptospira barantonii]
MFDFLKRQPSVPITDEVWISQDSKLEKCKRLLRKNDSYLFVFWFEDSLEKFQTALDLGKNSPNLAYAYELSVVDLASRTPIFCEHHPLRKTEQDLFLSLKFKEVTVFSSLDEPLFQKFGGEKVAELMKQLGVAGNSISHSWVTASIRRAQEKIAAKISIEQRTRSSQDEWFSLNLPG